MSRNSRDRLKAKRRLAAAEERRRRAASAPPAGDPLGVFRTPPHIPSQRQLVEQIITHAIHARVVDDIDELEYCVQALTAGPGGAVGVQVVNRVLLTCLLREVEFAWRRGWQPAELVRGARREHGQRHARIMTDAIAAQMRQYSVATVDPRWRSQLAAIDAVVWWEHDDHYVPDCGDRHNIDRAAVIETIVDVLHVIATAPTIEPVGPMPGTAPASSARPPAELDQRVLDRVRALLAKAESTNFPEEADAFTAKAQELMARHRIDHALVAAKTDSHDEPVTRRVTIENPYEAPKTLLLQVVAEANSCRSVWVKRFGFTTIVGFPAELDATELLFTSLLVQATRAMTHARPSPRKDGRNPIRSFRQSFLTSYASRIGERLRAATAGVDQEMAASVGHDRLLPVLAARDDAVRDVFERQFPELSQHTSVINNREGWASGRAAADRATLHGRPEVATTAHRD